MGRFPYRPPAGDFFKCPPLFCFNIKPFFMNHTKHIQEGELKDEIKTIAR
jgi:hypothetical protein